MSKITVLLPSKKEMLSRLLKANDDPRYSELYYPRLLRHAGKECSPKGVVLILQLEILKLPYEFQTIMNELTARLDNFIDALVEDNIAALQAKEFLATSRATKT
jgi:hypothetical protein